MEEALNRSKKVLFITLIQINDLEERGIYQDLLRQFIANEFDLYVVCSVDRRNRIPSRVIRGRDGVTILQLRTLNIQKSLNWEKALAIITWDLLLKRAIKKHFGTICFDLIIYTTPPITLIRSLKWLKKRSCAKTYLLLKDIFPQNAVDIGLIKEKSIIHYFFKKM